MAIKNCCNTIPHHYAPLKAIITWNGSHIFASWNDHLSKTCLLKCFRYAHACVVTIYMNNLTSYIFYVSKSVYEYFTFLHTYCSFLWLLPNMLCFYSEKKLFEERSHCFHSSNNYTTEQSQLIEHLFFAPLLYRGLWELKLSLLLFDCFDHLFLLISTFVFVCGALLEQSGSGQMVHLIREGENSHGLNNKIGNTPSIIKYTALWIHS